jgi:uncharacterized LabA/DUF88 family protein
LSKNVAVFVDVANLYYSARGLEVDVDYVALLKAATKGRDLIRAYAYSGLDPENENQRKFIDFLGKNDYKVVHKDIRKFGDGRVKANLDIELVVDLFRLADRMDIAVIVSGDGDFAPAIRALQDKGVRCEVISFRPNTSSDLIAVADEFIDIMKIIGIGRGKDADKASKVMSAPPMPAKEVVPEFGFREAPAAVAAAALAAIREGGAGTTSRGRGRGNARPPAVVEAMAPGTEEPPEAATPVEGATDGATGEARRRRRRRGGRGRGRGRGRADEATTTAPPVEAEIGWTEVDDISQVGLAEVDEVREYSFEEADAATLAELGLAQPDDAGVVVTVEEPAAGETPKPRRGRKPAAAATDAGPDAGPTAAATSRSGRGRGSSKATPGEAPAGKAARPRSRAAKPKDETPAAAAEPKPRTRSRAKPAAEAAPAEGAEEGIWQRFRGARAKAP